MKTACCTWLTECFLFLKHSCLILIWVHSSFIQQQNKQNNGLNKISTYKAQKSLFSLLATPCWQVPSKMYMRRPMGRNPWDRQLLPIYYMLLGDCKVFFINTLDKWRKWHMKKQRNVHLFPDIKPKHLARNPLFIPILSVRAPLQTIQLQNK